MENLILIFMLIGFITSWLLVKIIFIFVSIKYKFKIKFKFNRNQLTNISIIKYCSSNDINVTTTNSNDTTTSTSTNKYLILYEINIDKIWISSCYINRNVNDRFIICFNNVNVNVNINFNIKNTVVNSNNKEAWSSSLLIPWLLFIYFKYIGGLNIENLNFNLNNSSYLKLKSISLQIKKDKYLKLNIFDLIIKYLDKFELDLNRLVIENILINKTFLDLKEIDFGIDKAKLNIVNDFSFISFEKTNAMEETNTSSKSKLLNAKFLVKLIKSLLINKLIINNRHEMNKLELFNNNLDYLKLSINSLDDNCFSLSKIFRLIDNLTLEIFKTKSSSAFNHLNHHTPSQEKICYDLLVKCDYSNVYLNLINLKNLYTELECLNMTTSSSQTKKPTSEFRIEIKLMNSYLNLIDQNLTYIIGSKSLNFNTNLKSVFKLNLSEFVLFKSVNTYRNSFSSLNFSTNRKKDDDRFVNSLLNESTCLVDLFDKINRKKFQNETKMFQHVWGNLINCNTIQFRLILNEKSQKKFMHFFIDKIFIEYSPQIVDSILNLNFDHLIKNKLNAYNNYNNKNNNIKTNESNQFILNIKINQSNVYFIYERKYFIYFCLSDLNYKKEIESFSLNLKYLNCVQYRLDELVKLKPVDSINNNNNEDSFSFLNHSYINYFKEDDNSNLIFLYKMITINKSNKNELYFTVNDILCTWSLKIHFILNEILLKPVLNFRNLFKKFNLFKKNLDSKPFKFKLLIESNILVNFLFDYSQDSSKIETLNLNKQNNLHYFNSNFFLIETISIILNDVFLSYSSSDPNKFDLTINDVSMFTNVDDQSLTYIEDEFNSNNFDPCPYKRKFFHAHKLSISSDDKSDLLTLDRKLLNTKKPNNSLLSVNFDLIYVNFIFNYDFAKLIDHVLNLRKCLFLIHDINRKKQIKQTLSRDFLLNIKQLKLIIEDDPFEVKLSYNYALMSDEYLESIKRRQTLDQRRSIKENNLENQALEILRQRESKIYLTRSNMIYNKTSNSEDNKKKCQIRTELFCFCAENIEISALADLDWHDRQKCYDMMRKIDHFSPPPPKPQTLAQNHPINENSDFNPADHYLILWCRHVNLNVQDFKFLFRDYTQPLFKMNKLNLFGKLIGSEYEPSFRSKRQVKIGISSELSDLERCTFTIERNMSPFKFYYDMCSKLNLFSFAYGPCWEGCMAQLNLSLDKIIHPARDPSKPMPWWDKSRLYLHGRLTSSMQQCQIIYHVSMDPYNRTEEMKLVWNQLYFDWQNMEMFFKGTLDVFLNTESKYDDCCLLHLPNLEAKIKIDWICKSQMYNKSSDLINYNLANGHNLVMPCAKDKIPIVVNSFEHDSYSQFRSENVNLSFSFVCILDKANKDLPTCKFYASTSRFLERIKNLLSAITRPTKRGKLFQNLKPRKPILSRHFKFVDFNFDIPQINVIYWSSASEQYGIQLECKHFKMNSSLKLELIPFLDKLKRRPRPNWSIELMKFNLDQTSIYLMSPTNNGSILNPSNSTSYGPTLFNNDKFLNTYLLANQTESDPFMLEMNERSIKFLDAKPAIRNFFMKIDSIYYEREKNSLYNSYTMNKEPNESQDIDDSVFENLNESNNDLNQINFARTNKFSHSFKGEKQGNAKKMGYSKNVSGSLKIGKSIPNNQDEKSTKRSTKINPEGTLHTNLQSNTLTNVSMTSLIPFQVTNMPKHNLLIKNLKAKWNTINRDVVYILYEIYNKSKRLRHNLSSQALKQYDLFTDQIVQNHLLNQCKTQQRKSSVSSCFNANLGSFSNNVTKSQPYCNSNSNISKTNENISSNNNSNNKHFEELLAKLDSEKEINSNIYCNEKPSNQSISNFNDLLYGLNSINKLSDIVNENVFIEFINSQIKLSLDDSNLATSVNSYSTPGNLSNQKQQQKSQKKNAQNLQQQTQQQQQQQQQQLKNDKNENFDLPKSSTNNDYLIISSARANVVQRVHKPVWKSQRFLEKTSWSGYLENMQYFATLNQKCSNKNLANITALQEDNEYWLSNDIIDPEIKSSPNLHKSNLIIDINLANDPDKQSNSSGVSIKDSKLKFDSNQASYSNSNQINDKNESSSKPTKKSRKGLGLILGKSNNNKQPQNQQSASPVTENVYYTRNQLQLIVSKCRCEFYMIDFEDKLPNSSENLNNSSIQTSIQHQQSCSTSSLNLSNLYNLSNGHRSDNLLNTSFSSNNQYQIDLNSSFNEPIDCFTLIHHDLNLCSNSNQYKMIMDIVNSLVLYFRPRRKQVIDKQKSIKFNLQLSMGNLDSLKQYIQLKQIETKQLLCQLRLLEKQIYHLKEKIEQEINDYNQKYTSQQSQHLYNNQIYVIQELRLENKNLEKQYRECKKMLSELSDELNISISCYKEIMIEKRAINLAQTPLFVQHVLGNNNDQKSNNTLLFLSSPLGQTKYSSFLINGLNENGDATIDLDQLAQQSILNNEIPKRYEIWFKNTKWKLNDDDGKTGLAQFLMKNFLYTKVTNQQELDCVEHTLEIESCKLQDLTSVSNKNEKNKDSKKNKFYEDVVSSLFENLSNLSNQNNNESVIDDELNLSPNSPSSSASISMSNSLSNSSSNSSLALINNNADKNILSYNLNNNSLTMIRIYCKERPPVGIPVIEHLELNVTPLVINLTNRFFKMMIKYFFENQNQNQIYTNQINSQSQFSSQIPASFQRNTHQRHSYQMLTNEDQYNNLLNLNIGTASTNSNSNTNNNINMSVSSISPTSSSSNQNVILAPTNQLSSNANSNSNQVVNNGINLIPKVQSPNSFKNILSHHKKPSQSSLKSSNNLILSPTNIILANSNNSINNITTQNTNDSNSTNSNSNQLQIEDIEIMKQRSANNNTFLCIKIPEIQLLVSYKGSNMDKKNIKDLNNVSLLFPLFEVHDKTWTWLDLINALKSHVKKALLSQAIKHKLIKVPIQPVNKLINRNRRSSSQQQLTNLQIEEHEKLTMLKLFGTKFIEKNSQFTIPLSQPSITNKEFLENEDQNDKNSKIRINLSSLNEKMEFKINQETKEIKSEPNKKASLPKTNSSVGFGIKKHFLKFTRDKAIEGSSASSNLKIEQQQQQSNASGNEESSEKIRKNKKKSEQK